MIDQYRQMMAQGHFKGLSVLKFAQEIGELIRSHGCETLLDYGSGQGHQYMPPHSLDKKWMVDVTMYDPAVAGLETLPAGPFDVVLCSDVLEHVPIQEVPALLHNVFSRAKRLVFLTACPRPAKKHLPDGRNCHITILPMDRWMEEINQVAAGYKVPFVLRETP